MGVVETKGRVTGRSLELTEPRLQEALAERSASRLRRQRRCPGGPRAGDGKRYRAIIVIVGRQIGGEIIFRPKLVVRTVTHETPICGIVGTRRV